MRRKRSQDRHDLSLACRRSHSEIETSVSISYQWTNDINSIYFVTVQPQITSVIIRSIIYETDNLQAFKMETKRQLKYPRIYLEYRRTFFTPFKSRLIFLVSASVRKKNVRSNATNGSGRTCIFSFVGFRDGGT